jgi:hypothetical protein
MQERLRQFSRNPTEIFDSGKQRELYGTGDMIVTTPNNKEKIKI